eukprot:NODE_342_length_925_cov_487.507519_g334_i0.p3 GENE.NODE_342_length_925_cov_487.507519_g334_i0~~NODE_342_length_925_cov_487.507519_g334_i0.p3  ORF type:complete len:87 (+),score=13.53 NODE_342_length_925_cov_487.507519_g334_i0:580-840(+)
MGYSLSSLEGCSGGPVVDLHRREIVGFHVSGVAEENFAKEWLHGWWGYGNAALFINPVVCSLYLKVTKKELGETLAWKQLERHCQD